MLAVPIILAPVPVTTNMLALPTALILTFPFAAGMFTLLLPFAREPPVILPTTLPINVVAINAPFAKLAENAVLLCSE